MKKSLATLKPLASVFSFLIPIVFGAALLIWAILGRTKPDKKPEREQARPLRVLEIQPVEFTPKALGFGESRASQIFQAVAEVKGRIIELHPELKSGSFIRQGELLVALDTTDTELTNQRLEAEIARSKASLAELNATRENLDAALKIELSSLEVSKRELQRFESLVNRSNSASQAELDQQRRSVLVQQQSVQNLSSSLNLLPAQIESAQATIEVSQANLASSKRDLERCRIFAPFNCRVGPVDLELNEFVSAGSLLMTAQSTNAIDIEAQFSIDKLAALLRPDVEPPSIAVNPSMAPQETLRKFFDVDATVRYGATGVPASRQAKFERLREELDPQARTVGVIVSIDMPYQSINIDRSIGPPPIPGTYCEVELRAKPLSDAIIIPRSAIREDAVFVVEQVNGEDRLRRRPILRGAVQDNFALVKKGLNAGDVIVVSDPTPAIEDMLVAPILDLEIQAAIRTLAGQESVPE